MEENDLIPKEQKNIVSFDNMWALENIKSIDLDNLDENSMKKIKTDILIPLLSDNILGFLQELGEGDTYKLVGYLKDIDLSQYPNGDFRGVIYKNGRIIEHTRWEKVGINFTDMFKNFANVAMNMYIGNRLNEIEKITKKVLEGQFIDRVAKIHNNIMIYRRFKNNPEKRELVDNCMKDLSEGIIALKDQLFLQEMNDLNPNPKFGDDWGVDFGAKNKFEINKEKFDIIHFIVNIIIYGYKNLIEWDQDFFDDFSIFMNTCNWERIYKLARGILPINDNNGNFLYDPETDYKKIKQYKKDFINMIENDTKEQYIENKQFDIVGKANAWRRCLDEL